MLGFELEDLIRNAVGERKNIEFKGSMSWDEPAIRIKLIKTILAMSNIRDGGKIILGASQNGSRFDPVGMKEDHWKSFDYDHLTAQVAPYADPYVQFSMEHVDHQGKHFVVIFVQEFDQFPVICRKDAVLEKDNKSHLKRGKIYTRTWRMPESAEVSSLEDMREIIDLAIDKGLTRFVERASKNKLVTVTLSDSEHFDKQLEAFSQEGNIPTRLQLKGYWKVILRPQKFERERLRLQECEESILKSIITLRGYNYPHYYGQDKQYGELTRGADYVQWSGNIESYFFVERPASVWRMNQSGQFIHCFALMEDYWRDTSSKNVLTIRNALWSITEIYKFASNLALRNIFDGKITVEIQLHGMKSRQLAEMHREGLDQVLHPYYGHKCSVESLPFSRDIETADIIGKSSELALDQTIWLLERFGAYSPQLRYQLQESQEGFLKSNYDPLRDFLFNV
jgi:Putative DNA-binding domain